MSEDDIVLSVRNVSKCFEMYEKPVHRLYQTLCAGKKKFYKEFWALRDISFEVRKGECVGIIGRNGAGKSTLLQIVTGTLAPTTGEVRVKGRVAALLELGSGFNPEFTGRENVYLNGSILGLTKEEIDRRYDEILAFADIGEFINQPVKTYSSGMVVRLAFAVQVMVDPDVLIVDEALSVGDAAFQRKCFKRMEEMLAGGMTLLLVTHDTETVKRFCQRVVLLQNGRMDYEGPSALGVVRYFQYLFPEDDHQGEQSNDGVSSSRVPEERREPSDEYVYERTCLRNEKTWGNRSGWIKWVRIHGLQTPNLLQTPQKLKIDVCVDWDVQKINALVAERGLDRNLIVGYKIDNRQNLTVFGTNTLLEDTSISIDSPGPVVLSIVIDVPALLPDDYFLTLAVQLACGRKNPCYFDLEWDDVCIQLRNEVDGFEGKIGMVGMPTAYSIQRER